MVRDRPIIFSMDPNGKSWKTHTDEKSWFVDRQPEFKTKMSVTASQFSHDISPGSYRKRTARLHSWSTLKNFSHHAKFGSWFSYCVRSCRRSHKSRERLEWGRGWPPYKDAIPQQLLSYHISLLYVKPFRCRSRSQKFGDAGPLPRVTWLSP